MASVCYTWINSPFSWENARLAWSDFCIIQTILTTRRKAFSKKRKWYDRSYEESKIDQEKEIEEKIEELEEIEIQKIEDLNEVEKKAIINLVISMENKDSKILEEITKKKNSNIIIDIKDIEIIKTKSNQITLKINFDEI
jgi:hypothetical protein